MNVRQDRDRFTPDPDQMALWPEISGNSINGVGETTTRRPSPVYWHEPDSIPHGPLQNWFYSRYTQSPDVVASRARRQKIIDRPLPEVAPVQPIETPARWSALVKEMALSFGADDAGIARISSDKLIAASICPFVSPAARALPTWKAIQGIQLLPIDAPMDTSSLSRSFSSDI